MLTELFTRILKFKWYDKLVFILFFALIFVALGYAWAWTALGGKI